MRENLLQILSVFAREKGKYSTLINEDCLWRENLSVKKIDVSGVLYHEFIKR